MIQFARFQTSQLFPVVETPSPAQGFFAYFISDIPEAGLQTISIAEAWDMYTGFFVFMKDQPAQEDMAKLAADVTQYFANNYPEPSATGFAWLAFAGQGANAPVHAAAIVLSEPQPGQRVIAADMSFDFRNYSMPLKQSAPIVPIENTDREIIGFTYEYPPYEGAPVPRQAYNIQLPCNGPARGALIGQVSLGDLSASAATGWNASLYYTVHTGGDDVAQCYPLFDTNSADGLQILFDYRLDPVDPRNPDKTYLAFTGTSFFLKQNGEGNWYIELNAAASLPSFFRTVYGKQISLAPLTDSDHPPRLVFEELPPADGALRYYLAPAGDFELSTGDSDPAYLICGLSGAESIRFTPASGDHRGDVMRFVPGQPAFAPVFPVIVSVQPTPASTPHFAAARAAEDFARSLHSWLTAPGQTKASEQSLLTDRYKTSRINVRPPAAATPTEPEAPVYYSQPDDAALFDHGQVKVDVASEILELRNTPAAVFPAAVTTALPLVPYSGVLASAAFSYDEIRKFERQVMVTVRRETVSSIPVATQKTAIDQATEMLLTTTPQGLLATVPAIGLEWQSVLLAKSISKGTEYRLEFTDGITIELRDALQSNELFLVASEAAPLGNFLNNITIADWPFTIRVGKGSDRGDFGNILIFKFAGGSLEDRISDPQTWASAGTFNANPILVSKWIKAYIEAAKLQVVSDARYEHFLSIVQNPLWSGILALKVDIGVEDFPDDLKGLLAGINRDEFYAHHFGLEANFVQPGPNGELSLPRSSMFALINYVDRGYRSSQDTEQHIRSNPFVFTVQETPSAVATENTVPQELYDFRVLTLQVVFRNSEIKDFSSKIQLIATTWFDEPGALDTANMGNSLTSQTIEFDGSYEKHNGVNTYTFVTRPEQTYRFILQSQTINYVEIVKAQFYTITEQSGQDPAAASGEAEYIASRFVFWGYMNFRQIESFDLFSFGSPEDNTTAPHTGLYFANLYVGMGFMLDEASGTASDRSFAFDPGYISFDLAQSTPRSDSLFAKFPINLSGLIYSAKGSEAKPADLGYLPVMIQSPKAVKGQSLNERWYALLYDLNLGSMGALAAKAGFVSQLSTAWSPDTKAKRLATGIKLPGMGGQKTLSLQSVLSLHIQSFTFYSAYDDQLEGRLAYLLKFNNVKLSLLGKKLPGAADTQLILFGDTTGLDKTTLAWYAAYYSKPRTPPVPPPTVPPGRPPGGLPEAHSPDKRENHIETGNG